MKLYTEEQLREAYLQGWNDGQHDNIGYVDKFVFSLISIELPSDEEIEHQSNRYCWEESRYSYTKGAEWVIDKIKNQQ